MKCGAGCWSSDQMGIWEEEQQEEEKSASAVIEREGKRSSSEFGGKARPRHKCKRQRSRAISLTGNTLGQLIPYEPHQITSRTNPVPNWNHNLTPTTLQSNHAPTPASPHPQLRPTLNTTHTNHVLPFFLCLSFSPFLGFLFFFVFTREFLILIPIWAGPLGP